MPSSARTLWRQLQQPFIILCYPPYHLTATCPGVCGAQYRHKPTLWVIIWRICECSHLNMWTGGAEDQSVVTFWKHSGFFMQDDAQNAGHDNAVKKMTMFCLQHITVVWPHGFNQTYTDFVPRVGRIKTVYCLGQLTWTFTNLKPSMLKDQIQQNTWINFSRA